MTTWKNLFRRAERDPEGLLRSIERNREQGLYEGKEPLYKTHVYIAKKHRRILRALRMLNGRVKSTTLQKKFSNATADQAYAISRKLLRMYLMVPSTASSQSKPLPMAAGIYHLAGILHGILHSIDKTKKFPSVTGSYCSVDELFFIEVSYITFATKLDHNTIPNRRKPIERALLKQYLGLDCPPSSHRTNWFGYETEAEATMVYSLINEILERYPTLMEEHF